MTIPISLLFVHFVADFLFQSDWMAINKSKRWDALLLHVFVYVGAFGWWFFAFPTPDDNGAAYWGFILTTGVLHFLTDAITSRITSKLWFIDLYPVSKEIGGYRMDDGPSFSHYARLKASRHWFFVAIGFDQFLHYVALAGAWWVFLG